MSDESARPRAEGATFRRLARGAAWAVPAGAVAAAPSASAALAAGTITASLTSLSCVDPARSVFELVVCFTNNTSDDAIDLTLGSIEGVNRTSVNKYYYLPRNVPQCQRVTLSLRSNARPSSLILYTTYTGQNSETFTVQSPTKMCC